jgi:hypothetical protein
MGSTSPIPTAASRPSWRYPHPATEPPCRSPLPPPGLGTCACAPLTSLPSRPSATLRAPYPPPEPPVNRSDAPPDQTQPPTTPPSAPPAAPSSRPRRRTTSLTQAFEIPAHGAGGGEGRVSPLRRPGPVPASVPGEKGLSQPGAGAQDGQSAAGDGLTPTESEQVVGYQVRSRMCQRLQVVDQLEPRNREGRCQ